jgi:hypothetical protein
MASRLQSRIMLAEQLPADQLPPPSNVTIEHADDDGIPVCPAAAQLDSSPNEQSAAPPLREAPSKPGVAAFVESTLPSPSSDAEPSPSQPAAVPPSPSAKQLAPLTRLPPLGGFTPTPPRAPQTGSLRTPSDRSPLRNVGNVAVYDEDLRDLFDKFDSGKQGFLDVAAFKRAYAAMEDYGLPVSDRDLERVFRPFAPNGRLSYDAFCVVMLKRSRM